MNPGRKVSDASQLCLPLPSIQAILSTSFCNIHIYATLPKLVSQLFLSSICSTIEEHGRGMDTCNSTYWSTQHSDVA
jgi:hypothetical protein